MTYPALAAALILACLLGMQARATPYLPKDGAQVVERLPSRFDPGQRELQDLRKRLAASPADVALAAHLASRYIEIGRSHGDPRYMGYAQAAIARWWDLAEPPAVVRILRANLLQNQHRFEAALSDLDGILKSDRRNAQAWLTRAIVLQVQGRSAEAMASCARLHALAPELIAVTCIANVGSLTGQADRSYAVLRTTLERNPDATVAVKLWVQTLMAEMAARKNRWAAAEKHFRLALALDPADSYLLGAYADFLLDRQRAPEAGSLLENQTRIDGLLLRYAEALRRQRSPQADECIRALQARFAAATLRGDPVHQREQARFALHLMDDPASALRIARQNWQVQKEPADARILLEAAVAANDRETAQAVAEWVRTSGLEDEALATLVKRAGGWS